MRSVDKQVKVLDYTLRSMSIMEPLLLNLLDSANPRAGARLRKAVTSVLAAGMLLCCLQQSTPAQTASTASSSAPATVNAYPTAQELDAARSAVSQNPDDPKAHFQLAELLRRSRRNKEAAQEYLQTGKLEPTNYLAFHQLSTVDPDRAQLQEAIEQLTKLQQEKPKELMLRVALSELLEKEGSYYQAARVLVDLVYQNAVPDRYRQKVDARIHYLLAKSREAQGRDQKSYISEEELDSTPAPLPESSLHRDLTASKIHEPKSMRSVGNARLLP